MAKILYGIQSEGMGHAIRSRPLVEHLSRGNDVIILASEKVCSYYKRASVKARIINIQNYGLVYVDNKVSTFRTVFHNFFQMPWHVSSFMRIAHLIRKEKPDLIITDFEHITSYLGFFFRIPVISIDNEHILSNAQVVFPKEHWLDFMKSKLSVEVMVPRADKYLVCSFFFPMITSRKTRLIGPLLREKILALKPRYGKHILVYQTSPTSTTLIPSLKATKDKFIVYGMARQGKDGNILFKEFNESSFFRDLAHSKAVIMNGGFTLMTEALYLKKPILSVPIRRQFEQVLNAEYLQKLGYGLHCDDFSKENINLFLDSLEKYKKNLSRYSLVGNKDAIKEINGFIG
jgi:uncharacterized protein (TIGR00661 family)